MAAPFSATRRMSSPGRMTIPSTFGAPLMECKLQSTNVEWCVTLLSLPLLTLATIKVHSLSYHAASGNIAVGLAHGFVQVWQTTPHIASSAAPRAPLPTHVCVRQQQEAAESQVKDIEASIERAEEGLRPHFAREQELNTSIADLEVRTFIT